MDDSLKLPEKITVLAFETIFRQEKFYILFKIDDFPYYFLYFTNLQEPVRAMYFGPNIMENVQKAMGKSENSCIECETCVDIVGGVSISGHKMVEMSFSYGDSIRVLNALKKRLDLDLDPHILKKLQL